MNLFVLTLIIQKYTINTCIEYIYCSYCPLQQNIPFIEGYMNFIVMIDCPLLADIPIGELHTLNSSSCTFLTNIQLIMGLKYIYLNNCSLLKRK